jgi:Leucine-rich repeat (LRR) protein
MRSLDCTNSNIKKFIVVNESKGRASCWVTEKDKPVELHYDLENINCSYNSIKAISWLPFLKFLICNNNKIRKIDSMKSLKECDIRSNRLKKIPFINEKFMYEFSEDKIKDYSYNYNVHTSSCTKIHTYLLLLTIVIIVTTLIANTATIFAIAIVASIVVINLII